MSPLAQDVSFAIIAVTRTLSTNWQITFISAASELLQFLIPFSPTDQVTIGLQNVSYSTFTLSSPLTCNTCLAWQTVSQCYPFKPADQVY